MSKTGVLKLLGIAVIGGVGYAAFDIWQKKNECFERAAALKAEAAYFLRHGCMFKMPEGWSSIYYEKAK